MKGNLVNRKTKVLIAMEIRQFFLHQRSLHFIPLSLIGVLLVLWPYFSSPFVPVFIVLFAGLEPQFSNILFRTPLELESLSVLPLGWEKIARAKNIAAVILVCIVAPILAATLMYFSPSVLTLDDVKGATLYLSTVLLPLIHVGNLRSVQHPRRKTGWQFDDLAGSVELLINLGVLSIPYALFVEVLNVPALCIPYFAASIMFWWRYSIPKTAQLIETERITVCLTV